MRRRQRRKRIEKEFWFKNMGSDRVKIESVKGCCSCLQLDWSPAAVAPVQRGSIKATFIIGQRRGTHSKLIMVKTDKEKEETVLSLTVDIKEPMKVSPMSLSWGRGEESSPKSIQVALAEGDSGKTVKATPANPDFSVTVNTIKEGREYRLDILPKTTGAPASCQIAVEAELATGKSQISHVTARVK